MDVYMVILRLIHFFGGTFWVGAGILMIWFISPTVRALGKDGQTFMKGFVTQSKFTQAMPVASMSTTISGLLLYYSVSDHFNSDWITSAGGVVLTIGSVAGIAATLHGIMHTGPTTSRLAALGKQIDAQGGPPSESQLAELRTLQAKNAHAGQISLALMIVAVIGMAAARYM